MAEDGSSAPQSSPHGRRSSFAGQTFADLFGAGRSSMPRPSADGGNNSPPNQYAGAISQAAAKAQQRRMSLTTLGLSGTANGTSPYNSYRGQDSVGSANSSAIDEVAVDDDVGPATARDPTNGSGPNTPFARRMSFGARALRDVSGGKGGGGGGGGGGSPGQNGTASPSPAAANKTPSVSTRQNGTISSRTADAKGRGEGFNWSDNFRTRAERTASIGGSQGGLLPAATAPGSGNHVRAVSVATMEPPMREMPKEQKRPDHFQERILKGDFYMD